MGGENGRKGEKRAKSSFLGRAIKRLLGLAIVLALLLVAGFRHQSGKWAWEDRPAFEAYALSWWRFAKEKAVAAGDAIRQKADETGITARTQELIERARRALAGEPATPPPPPPAPGSDTGAPEAEPEPSGKGGAPAPARAGKGDS